MASMIMLTNKVNFDFGSSEYRSLIQRARGCAFQHPDWLMAFYRHLIKEHSVEPLVLVGRSKATGQLMAVIPLVRRTVKNMRIVEFAFAGVTDYACAVIDPHLVSHLGNLPRFHQELGQALGHHDVLCVEPVRQIDVEIWEKLLGIAPSPLEFGSHSVRPETPFPAWRTSNLGSRKRSQLDRKIRRLNERGSVRLRVLPAEETAEALAWAKHCRSGRFPDDPIQQEDVLDFYRDVASTGAKSGFARTYQLSCGDKPVAMCFGLVDGDHYRYLVLACDYETYARYSPGILILDLAMADWASEGGKVFDFTIGDERFKNVFRCKRTPMFKFAKANTEYGQQHLRS